MKAKVALLLEGIDIRERWHRDARATPGGSGQGHSRGPAYRRRASGASPGSAKFDGMAVGILLVTHPGIGSALVAVATSLLRNLPLKVEAFEVPFDGDPDALLPQASAALRSEEHTSELQSLIRISYYVL